MFKQINGEDKNGKLNRLLFVCQVITAECMMGYVDHNITKQRKLGWDKYIILP